jgi:hypothetical protein
MERDSAVTIRNVTVSHVGDGIQIANGRSDSGGVPLAGLRYSIHDVIVDDLNAAKYAGFGTFAQISTGRGIPVVPDEDATINHVTAFLSNAMLTLGDDIQVNAPMTNFVFTNNMVNAGAYPVLTTCGGTANCAYYNAPLIALYTCFQPYTFSHNAVMASSANFPPSKYPFGNYFPPTAAAVDFVNYNGGDYHLQSNSPYKNAGTDGKDLGADVDALRLAIAGIK